MQMINKSFLCLTLLLSLMSLHGGKNTADAFYYMTKGACITAGVAGLAGSIPVIACVVPAATIAVPVTSTAVKSASIGVMAASETLAQKAYNLGMKL